MSVEDRVAKMLADESYMRGAWTRAVVDRKKDAVLAFEDDINAAIFRHFDAIHSECKPDLNVYGAVARVLLRIASERYRSGAYTDFVDLAEQVEAERRVAQQVWNDYLVGLLRDVQ